MTADSLRGKLHLDGNTRFPVTGVTFHLCRLLRRSMHIFWLSKQYPIFQPSIFSVMMSYLSFMKTSCLQHSVCYFNQSFFSIASALLLLNQLIQSAFFHNNLFQESCDQNINISPFGSSPLFTETIPQPKDCEIIIGCYFFFFRIFIPFFFL